MPNQGDGWSHALDELGRYFDRASGRMYGPDPVTPDPRPLLELADADPPPAALEVIGAYLHAAATLGRRTAEMHLALARDSRRPGLRPGAAHRGRPGRPGRGSAAPGPAGAATPCARTVDRLPEPVAAGRPATAGRGAGRPARPGPAAGASRRAW